MLDQKRSLISNYYPNKFLLASDLQSCIYPVSPLKLRIFISFWAEAVIEHPASARMVIRIDFFIAVFSLCKPIVLIMELEMLSPENDSYRSY